MTRVLIVDDKPENLYLLRSLLQGHGCIVDEARHGAEALVKARQAPPDIIVSDLLMPVMDGFTLLHEWKADERLKPIPFVVYTATYTEPKDERLARDLGADAFILKPAEPDLFMGRLQDTLARAQRQDSLPTRVPAGDAKHTLKEYGEVIIRKLEEKARELEQANRALQDDLAQRQAAEATALRLQSEAERARGALLSIMEDQRQAEGALRESQALYRSLVEHIPAGVFRKDAAGRYVFVNACYCRIHGMPSERFLGRTAREVADDFAKQSTTQPELQLPIRQSYLGGDHHQTIMATGQPIELEEEWLQADGSRCYYQSVKTPVFDAAGKTVGSQGILIDITERKRAGEELRQRDSELQEAQRMALVGSWRLDPATNQVKWTEGLYHMLGLDPTQPPPPATEHKKLFSPASWERLSAALANSLQHGTPYELELEMIRRDGSKGWMLARGEPVRDASGAMVGLRGVAQDITARRESERRIREQADLIDKAKEAIIASDLDRRITFWNRGAEHMLGWSAEEMLGKSVLDMLAVAGVTDAGLYTALATEEDWQGEIRGHNRGGRIMVAEVGITMLRDDAGQPTGRLGVISDITEKKTLEEKFLRSQRLESIGMLAAGIAHDLNNVLAPISMGAPMLRATATTPRDQRLLDTLERCAERGAGLARQILGFAHGIGGEPRLVQVKHLLRDIASVITETFPKSITIEDRVPSNLWPVMANPTQIHQVLLNLCVNARDAMPNGGTLRLRGENCLLDAAAAAAIDGARPGAWLVLHVEDTGTGIPPEVLPRIWEPFFTTKSVDKGTGLGLPTVRGIVETHHGFIALSSEVGRGTTFRVYLPAAESDVPGEGHGIRALAARGHGELVLVVDDEDLIRETLNVTLSAQGYRVITANDGAAGSEQFAAHAGEIALVITDLDMPKLDGGALGRMIRAQDPTMKILVMSGLTDNSRTKAFRPEDFATDFLRKPFTIEELNQLVEKHLPTASPKP